MSYRSALPCGLALWLAAIAPATATDDKQLLTSSIGKASANAPRQLVGLKPIDGATFVSKDRQVYRLVSIRPPRDGDVCKDSEGAVYDCAARARTILQTLSMGLVTCRQAGPADAEGAIPARCTDMADRDIGRLMVAAGWALPDETDMDYAFDAMEALARGKGLWQGRFRITRR